MNELNKNKSLRYNSKSNRPKSRELHNKTKPLNYFSNQKKNNYLNKMPNSPTYSKTIDINNIIKLNGKIIFNKISDNNNNDLNKLLNNLPSPIGLLNSDNKCNKNHINILTNSSKNFLNSSSLSSNMSKSNSCTEASKKIYIKNPNTYSITKYLVNDEHLKKEMESLLNKNITLKNKLKSLKDEYKNLYNEFINLQKENCSSSSNNYSRQQILINYFINNSDLKKLENKNFYHHNKFKSDSNSNFRYNDIYHNTFRNNDNNNYSYKSNIKEPIEIKPNKKHPFIDNFNFFNCANINNSRNHNNCQIMINNQNIKGNRFSNNKFATNNSNNKDLESQDVVDDLIVHSLSVSESEY